LRCALSDAALPPLIGPSGLRRALLRRCAAWRALAAGVAFDRRWVLCRPLLCGAHTQAHDHTGRRRQSSVCSNESATPASFDLAQVGRPCAAVLPRLLWFVRPSHRCTVRSAAVRLQDSMTEYTNDTDSLAEGTPSTRT
jgi:hypothetical protein